MKIMVSIFTLFLAANAHAIVDMNNENYPIVKCTGNSVVANVYNLPNEKQAQMVVQVITRGGPIIVYNDMVQTVSAEDSQVFVADTATLRVIPNGKALKGFLNLHREQPGVGQVLNCTTYAHILSATEVL